MEQLKQNTILKRFVNGIYTRKDADRIIHLFRTQQHTKQVDDEMDQVWQAAQGRKQHLSNMNGIRWRHVYY